MREAIKSAPRFDEEVAGMPVEAHGYIVTPYARMRGMVGVQRDERSSGRYGWAAIRPVRMTVQTLQPQDMSGEVREVRLTNAEGQALRAFAVVAALLLALSLLMPLLNRGRR